ncbi:glycine cleavage system protein GcvH [Hyalangium minutum]|uniref:Glycine cleavage system H protein n=1 Tax=Hyalangium minutum TaxID=394096 RepID=A0A085W308_9BACT|nr:glycine cleavage system protein GcvH [Hyalangium minutum]KFE62071.1 Glycine cleavage system H protein [Hyalangium minutum]
MADVPQNLKYTQEHEWIRVDNGVAVVGITQFASNQLGDVVFVDVPTVGKTVEAGDSFGTVESVKAVSELFAPVSGKVVEVNSELEVSPELVNEEPYGDGWIIKLQPSSPKDIDGLLSPAAYADLIKQEQEG